MTTPRQRTNRKPARPQFADAVEQSERVRAWRFIAAVIDAVGQVEVARILHNAGFATDESGRLVEKIGECASCRLRSYVKMNPAGRFVCINCRFNEVEREIQKPLRSDPAGEQEGRARHPAPVILAART